MTTLRPHLLRLSWIALVAMLALALVPTLSRALGMGAEAAGHCVMPRLQADTPGHGAGQPAALRAQAILDHCPLCALGLGALVLAPVPSSLAALGLRADAARPWQLLRAQPRPSTWRSPEPRAPPPQA